MSDDELAWGGIWVDSEWMSTANKKPAIKCECGVTIALGKDDNPMFHSDYCPIKEQNNLQEFLRGKESCS